MAYAYAYPTAGYMAAPTAPVYYYQPVPQPAPYVAQHNPQYYQYIQQHQNQQLLHDSATNIQRLARGFTERRAQHVDPPKTGSVVVIVHGAAGVRNAQCCFTQSPYAMVTYGRETQKTKTHSSGGRYPEFKKGQLMAFRFLPDVENVKVELFNSNMFCDDPLGYVLIPVEDLWKSVSRKAEPQDYQLTGKHGAGSISVTAFYVPPLHITVHRCKDLHNVQSVGKQDPFVVVSCPGAVGAQERRTPVCRDGDRAPKWEGAGATHTFLLRHQWHLQRPRSDDEKDDEEARPVGPGIQFQIVNKNHVKDKDIAYVRIPWELTLKTWLRGAVWSELTIGNPKKTKKARPGGYVAWSVSGGPTVRDDEEREQQAHPPQHYGLQPMPTGPMAGQGPSGIPPSSSQSYA